MIYAIRDGAGNIKIGRAKSPLARLVSLQTGCSSDLELIMAATVADDAATERMFHQSFAHRHVRGEWFSSGLDLTIACAKLEDGSLDVFPSPPLKPAARKKTEVRTRTVKPDRPVALTPAQRHAKWQRAHPEKHAARQRAYRARKKLLKHPDR